MPEYPGKQILSRSYAVGFFAYKNLTAKGAKNTAKGAKKSQSGIGANRDRSKV